MTVNVTPATPVTTFELPAERVATSPPEHRGLRRDAVRLLVARPEGVEHRRFDDLPDLLVPGDLLVINTSGTLPAAVDGRREGSRPAPVHVSTTLDDGTWVIEVRRLDGTGPDSSVQPGEAIELPGGVELTVQVAYPVPGIEHARLWRAVPEPATDALAYIQRHGRPITYGHLHNSYPIADYQTVYATTPGSAEMPSAGRPFTESLLVRLMAHGVTIAPVVLHAGVSSPDAHEPPFPERYDVPAVTARLVNCARAAGRRVIAVGTTVTRALETAATPEGLVRPAGGWTDVVLGPDRPAHVVDGLITGLHEPQASHLLLLEAVAGVQLVGPAYRAAAERGYLWHEFGDSTLLLP